MGTSNDLNLQIIMQRQPILKAYILYDSIYIAFLNCHNYRNRVQMSGCWGGSGLEGDRKWGQP